MYYDTHALLSSAKSRIYVKEEHKHVKEIISYKFAKDSNTFVFEFARPRTSHSLEHHVQLESMYIQIVSQ